MKISFAITTHNEGHYIKNLLDMLVIHIKNVGYQSMCTYEIVIVDDHSTDPETLRYQEQIAAECNNCEIDCFWYLHKLNDDFAVHKNFMNLNCTGDWILHLDADETISTDFLSQIPFIIKQNPQVDAYWLPRVNTVDGLTLKHVQQWHWILTTLDDYVTVKYIEPTSAEYELLDGYDYIINEENGYVTFKQPIICWPDIQMRLYKNNQKIQWVGKVHERLTGFSQYGMFPHLPFYAIRHHKDIERQERQNALYAEIQRK